MIWFQWLKEQFDNTEGRSQIQKADKLKELAGDLGVSVHHLALLWCAKNENVSTIILGASKLEQLKDNLKVIDKSVDFNNDILERIEEIVQSKPEPEKTFE